MSLTMTRGTASRVQICRIHPIFLEKQPHIFIKYFLVFFQRQNITRVFFRAFFAISVWVPMASKVHASGTPFSSLIYFFSHFSLLFPNISTFAWDVAPQITAVNIINSTSYSGYHTLRSRRISSIPSSTSCKLSCFITMPPSALSLEASIADYWLLV